MNKLIKGLKTSSFQGVSKATLIKELTAGLSNLSVEDQKKLKGAIVQYARIQEDRRHKAAVKKDAAKYTPASVAKLIRKVIDYNGPPLGKEWQVQRRLHKELESEAFETALDGWFERGSGESLLEALYGTVFSDGDTYRKFTAKEADKQYNAYEKQIANTIAELEAMS